MFHPSVHMDKNYMAKVLTVWAIIVLNFCVGMFWKQPEANILLTLVQGFQNEIFSDLAGEIEKGSAQNQPKHY